MTFLELEENLKKIKLEIEQQTKRFVECKDRNIKYEIETKLDYLTRKYNHYLIKKVNLNALRLCK
ncbi:hypothetical protein [Candidatus Phytoplasma solani]|uniref:Uncharacterized protein n=1 Tax=Candidatus Phytoplasma solani TaxID=69896 RepID=A0A421NUR2_9MOLU|nr:hypothetical protein [Candidatus Phytoplasma solani]RMI87679.1 hypothetical protein PSSA1_v1c6290 [Candidatus Phytoplasma solani]RMI87766.1 hypothetical protein PSSA1_v1c6010 [Candidatus Phytoplasma solani]RMI88878.1 hypothetical protein PSSA1_v1c3050 [Candidatus Phytoplasma solani]